MNHPVLDSHVRIRSRHCSAASRRLARRRLRAGRGPQRADGIRRARRLLPGGGWPAGALTEIHVERAGVGELQLVMPAAARLTRSGRWLTLVAPPYVPYAPAFAAHGVMLSRLMLVRPATAEDGLWACEQALRSQVCAAVLAWFDRVPERSLRRLQLAAESGGASHADVPAGPCRACFTGGAAAARHQIAKPDAGAHVEAPRRRGAGARRARPARRDARRHASGLPAMPLSGLRRSRPPCQASDVSADAALAWPPEMPRLSTCCGWRFASLRCLWKSSRAPWLSPGPLAVASSPGANAEIVACNARARSRGVRAGMPVAAASALAADLRVLTRDPAAERAALERIAACAIQFSPTVSIASALPRCCSKSEDRSRCSAA